MNTRRDFLRNLSLGVATLYLRIAPRAAAEVGTLTFKLPDYPIGHHFTIVKVASDKWIIMAPPGHSGDELT